MTDELVTISPIDGSVAARRRYASATEIHTVLTQAQHAQRAWRETPLPVRASLISSAVDAMVANKADIAQELTQQMGRPIRYTPGEVGGFEARARHMIKIADESLRDVVPEPIDGFTRYIKRVPVGVVLVIAPWNYPMLTAVNAVVPALLAGNTVILKHSAQTPLVAERFEEAFQTAGLPAGVFQIVHTTHDDAQRMIRAPEINFVCFTGSVAGGIAVEQAAAGRFIGVGLELGGADPAYVRADADIAHAVETLVDGAFFNSGQSCCGIQRIYVHRSVYDDFVARATALTKQYVLGDPRDPQTTLGPVVRASAAERIRGMIDDAVHHGARTMIDASGFSMNKSGTPYVSPQILANANHTMKIMREECFGPACGVMAVHDDNEAVRYMNDSQYGLTAAIFTRDMAAAQSLGDHLETGTVFMNRCDYLDPALAWTGVKSSGRGATLSKIGFEHLTRPKSFHLKTKW